MTELTDTQLAQAEARGQRLLKTALQATTARYDRDTGRVIVDLTNGCTYVFPAQLVQDLRDATPDALAVIQVDGAGFNLHWPVLDVDLPICALVSGVFGTRDWMARQAQQTADSETRP